MAEQIAKLKKKQWYQIVAPKQFNEVVLGETLVYEPQAMLGKRLRLSLMNLTNDNKKQNTAIHFKVVEIDSDKGKTNITGYQITSSSVKRHVRRNSEKISLSFQCESSDNVSIRVKPFIVTKSDINGSVGAKLRSSITSFLTKAIKKITFEDFINELISHKLQDEMKANSNKIFPLKVCEVRYAGIEEIEKPQESKADAKV